MNQQQDPKTSIGRRNFIKSAAAVTAASTAARSAMGASRGSDTLRAVLVGCGSRGTSAAKDFALGAKGAEIVGLVDLFQDKLDATKAKLTQDQSRAKKQINIDDDLCLTGWDAYERILETDIDIVLLATPPGFRPQFVEAAVKAGKHLFMEKPGCVDAAGARKLIAAGELAKRKDIAIVAGTQQRRMAHYMEILKRIHRGDIGDIVAGQCYWHWGHANWHYADRKPEWSDMEWQIRCWPFFTWLSGDHIVEQHCHNLDVMNWAIGTHPETCLAVGGRQARGGIEHGNIYDHFAVEYEYPNGVRVLSMASQIEGSTGRVGERLVGTKGQTYTDRGQGYIEGRNAFKYEGVMTGGFQEEHRDLVNSIRGGKPLNEARQIAESTLTAIMGRMSAYTGRALKFDWVLNASKEDLSPGKYELGDIPVGPIAVPGKTKLV